MKSLTPHKMQIYKEIVQGSPEWYAIRKQKMTASHAQAIGASGKGLETYIIDMMAESYSSGEYESYTNKHLERGNELEPLARDMYSLETGSVVEQVGFVEYNEYVGASPDGLIGEDGLLEIKCCADKKHFRLMLHGEKEIDTAYLWQVQMQMLVTGREWCDLVFYNPNFQKSLLIFRVIADPAKHAKLLEGFAIGEGKIRAILAQLPNPM